MRILAALLPLTAIAIHSATVKGYRRKRSGGLERAVHRSAERIIGQTKLSGAVRKKFGERNPSYAEREICVAGLRGFELPNDDLPDRRSYARRKDAQR
jgi:hypothetical protein